MILSNLSKLVSATAIALTLSLATGANAATQTINYDTEFSGAFDPAGPPPWLRATFEDAGGGDVKLTFEAIGLVGSEFVTTLTFNVDPAKTGVALSIIAGSQVGSFADPTIAAVSQNSYNANGAHDFDILIEFDNAPPGDRFGAGEAISFLISADQSLVPEDFLFTNGAGGHTGLYTGAHVQGIGTSGANSGWVTGDPNGNVIPTPAALPAGLALVALAALRRRRNA